MRPVKTKFSYALREKILFYFSYVYYKIILPFEVRKPRFKLWFYEWVYSLKNLFAQMGGEKFPKSFVYPFRDTVIETRFGKFRVRPRTSDPANVSPAFERRDVNFLTRLVRKSLAAGKRTLLLDIGGDIGTYTVAMAKYFPELDVACFEPIPESCRLIRENLKKNHVLKNTALYPVALTNGPSPRLAIRVNAAMPGSSSSVEKNWKTAESFSDIHVKAARLDGLFGKKIAKYDTIVFKIDVEGMEQKVLEGAKKILKSGKEIWIMVEDFVEPSIIRYLEKSGAAFVAKKTDYNSWWKF